MEWKNIDGYESYSVSRDGKVRNDKKGIILKGRYTNGYQYVTLYKNGKGKNFRVHRLVAEAFIPNLNNLPCVDHINTVRDYNRVENLRWCTYKENNNNPLTLEKMNEAKSGENHPQCKKVICITTGEIFNTIKQIEEEYKINHANISLCCNGKRKSAGKDENGNKLVWMYYEDYLESLK